jgi:hypothetical protein
LNLGTSDNLRKKSRGYMLLISALKRDWRISAQKWPSVLSKKAPDDVGA